MKIMSLLALFIVLIIVPGCQPNPTPEIGQGQYTDTVQPTSIQSTEPLTTPQPEVASTIVQPTATPQTSATLDVIEIETQPATVEPEIAGTPTATVPVPERLVSSIQLEPVAAGFEKPTYLTHAQDKRLFVTEEVGQIWIVQDGAILPEPFLDIQTRVGSMALEQGLLSVAFDPAYQENGRFFVNYTDVSGTTIVSAFHVSSDDPDRADASSEQILLRINQPFVNHNGGQLQFGPDGYLYIGMGDGGSANDPQNNGQNPGTLLGALLRLDVTDPNNLVIPRDNPFSGASDRREEIWAIGLRNPWRFSFDRLTGDLYIADVGQNLWEEVNFQSANSVGGENYGWNIMEGSHCFLAEDCDTAGFILPVAEYNHQEGCSITGGYVYRGSRYPTLLGNYFFSDYCLGSIWSLLHQSDGTWTQDKVFETNMLVSSFGEDVDGELYVLDHRGGAVYQIAPGL